MLKIAVFMARELSKNPDADIDDLIRKVCEKQGFSSKDIDEALKQYRASHKDGAQ